MKKLTALVLTLVLALGICANALAAPFYLESLGVTIDVPDGMTGEDASNETHNILKITVDGDNTIGYAYTLGYIEEYDGLWLEDLSEEQAQELGQGIAAAIVNPSLTFAEVNDYYVLVVANEAGSELHYISLLGGYLCDVAAIKLDGSTLNDDEIKIAAYLLTSIEFDGETEEGAEEEVEDAE